MKNILFLFEKESSRSQYLISTIKDEYNIISVHSFEDAKEELNNYPVAFIVDKPSSLSYAKELFTYVEEKNDFIFTFPVIILTDKESSEKDDQYLSQAVVGIILEGTSQRIVLQRIKNTIKFANSTGFDDFSRMLNVLPSLVYLKDRKGRYVFCSQHWHHLYDHLRSEDSIRGKTDLDIRKDKNNARIAMESDMKVINTGKGTNYIIREEDDEGVDYLQIIKEPLRNNKGEIVGIIAIINNVTDSELLRQELRKKSITDQLTGLYNRFYFEELSKDNSKKLNKPITIISADCDGLKKINDKFGHLAGDEYICFAKEAIKESLPDNAAIFRMGGDEFLAVLPGVNRNKASEYVAKIIQNAKKYRNDSFALRISVGSYTITKNDFSIESGVALSDKAMYKMKKSRK